MLAALAVATPSVGLAHAQAPEPKQPTDAERKALGEALLNAIGAGGSATTPGATTPGAPGIPGAGGTALPTATTPGEPGATATDGTATTPPAAPGGVASGLTPAPPAYLVPGPGAAQQPIASVARLTESDVPAEPIRIAALAAALLALLAVAAAVLLRTLGFRTPVLDPVAAPADGPAARIGERIRGTADDMRDFLRRSR